MKAIIVGAKGQDGTLLAKKLMAKGYIVIGIDRDYSKSSDGSVWGDVNILNSNQVADLLNHFLPNEIYYLAACHYSSQGNSASDPGAVWKDSLNVNVQGVANFLEGMRCNAPESKLFYASSSLVFGSPQQNPQTEETPLDPKCIYSITKSAGMQCCKFYRDKLSLFASVGILYNHESCLRPEDFLSQKIIKAAKRIMVGEQQKLILGDLSAKTDWGYAPDFIDAMWRIMQLDKPDDFIIATGKPHSVQDWVENVFGLLDLDWRKYVHEDRSLITREKAVLLGDSSKLFSHTGWNPTTSFVDMIAHMMNC